MTILVDASRANCRWGKKGCPFPAECKEELGEDCNKRPDPFKIDPPVMDWTSIPGLFATADRNEFTP